ncbi:MAG TPA: UdgX family uracil-DNA binding protein [Chthoniobacterales bacterium]
MKIAHEAIVPKTNEWSLLRKAASRCQACPLWKNATQTVFGEGLQTASIFFIGEQPGDREDREGKPFVGPAGRLLDRALADAGLDRDACYVTNAVKHFKNEPRGKRRLHKKPNQSEIAACKPWWKAELALIRPRTLVCLGATAARVVFEREVRVQKERGAFLVSPASERTLVTVHPSSLLRVPDSADREREYGRFVEDLRRLRSP